MSEIPTSSVEIQNLDLSWCPKRCTDVAIGSLEKNTFACAEKNPRNNRDCSGACYFWCGICFSSQTDSRFLFANFVAL